MARLFDKAKMTVSGTPSTGTFTLASAVVGDFQTFFAAGVLDSITVSYAATGAAGWEVGRGVTGSSATTLTRGPLFSSNSNAAVDFGSDAVVWITILAEDLIQTITLSGNTDGSTSPIFSPDLELAGGLNITLSGTSNTISIIGAATVAQSAQTLGLFAVGNTTGTTSSQTRDARTISFDGAGIASVGFSAGSIIVSASSAASGVVQNEYLLGNTTGATSSSTQTLSSVSLSGAGIVSVGFSTTAAGAGAIVISASTAATNPLLSIYAVGNTTSDASSGLNAAGSLSFDGAGIVSVGVAGSSVIISAPSPAASGTIQNRFADGNSFGQSSSAVGTLSSLRVSATGGISAGFSTDASSAVLMLSVAPPVASGVVGNYFASGNTTAISSSSTHTLSNISVSGAGIVSVGVSTTGAGAGILVVSASTAATNPLLSVFAVGNTTTSVSSGVIAAGSLSFDGAGAVSVGISNSSIVISSPATIASQGSLSLFAVGNTTISSSTSSILPEALSLSGAGIVTVGYSSNTILLSATTAASGAVQNQYAIGNTTALSSSTTQTLSSVSLSGAGIVSVGYSTTAAGAGAIVISASTAATNPLLSLYAVGNTTTSVSSGLNQAGSLSFDGAGIVSVGISGSSVVISAPSPAASGTVGNYFASGNTTALSSSSTHTLSNLSISGAGIVSVGVTTSGAGAGILLVSASTAATNPLISVFAVGNTTSSVSSGVIAAGSLSFDGAGIVSVGVSNSSVVISAPTPAASATAGNFYAIGNTTGLSSSSTMTLSSISISGAGAISVGFSTTAAGAGAYQISGPLQNLSLYAVGNTTVSSSTSSVIPEALSFSASGPLSIGYSSNTIIFSAATATAGPQSIYAVGNTIPTEATSAAIGAGSISFDALGALSVGLSNSSVVMSMPSVSSLVGVSGISLSTAGSTISILQSALSLYAVSNTTSSVSSTANEAGSISFAGMGAVSIGMSNSSIVISAPTQSTISYIEPIPWFGSTSQTLPIGTMMVQPLKLEAPLTMNQAQLFVSRAIVAPIVTVSTTGASTTGTASAAWGATSSFVIYSREAGANSNSFSSFSSTTAGFSMQASYSVSFASKSSVSASQTISFVYPQGTSQALTSSMSASFSSATAASWSSQTANASTSNFTAWLRADIPLLASFPASNYLIGFMSSQGTSTATGFSLITIAAPTWSGGTHGVATLSIGTVPLNLPGVPNAAGTNPFAGLGFTSSAASALPATIAWGSLSSTIANASSYPRVYMQLGLM